MLSSQWITVAFSRGWSYILLKVPIKDAELWRTKQTDSFSGTSFYFFPKDSPSTWVCPYSTVWKMMGSVKHHTSDDRDAVYIGSARGTVIIILCLSSELCGCRLSRALWGRCDGWSSLPSDWIWSHASGHVYEWLTWKGFSWGGSPPWMWVAGVAVSQSLGLQTGQKRGAGAWQPELAFTLSASP